MPTTEGVFYDYGASVLTYLAAQVQVKLYMHLFVSPSSVNVSDFPPGAYSDLDAVGYAPVLLTSSQLVMTPAFPPWKAKISGVSWTVGPVLFGSNVVLGWWLEARTPGGVPTTALYGGLFDTPIVVPPTGATIEITDLELTLHNCGGGTAPTALIWEDPFVDTSTPVTSHSPLIGSGYTAGVGTFTVNRESLAPVSANQSDYFLWDDHTTNWRYSWDEFIGFTSGTDYASLDYLFRFQDINNYFVLNILPQFSAMQLQKIIGGVPTNLQTVGLTADKDVSWHVQVTDDGAGNIVAVCNDGAAITVTDGSLLAASTKGFFLTASSPANTTLLWHLTGVAPYNA